MVAEETGHYRDGAEGTAGKDACVKFTRKTCTDLSTFVGGQSLDVDCFG